MAYADPNDETSILNVSLKLEDEFLLTRLRNKARTLSSSARDQYLWEVVFKLVCKQRAYQSVMEEVGLSIDTNVKIFEEDGPAESES